MTARATSAPPELARRRRRRRLGHAALAAALLLPLAQEPGAAARVREPRAAAAPLPTADELLTAIDFVPSRADLDRVMGPTTLPQLVAWALDADRPLGIRLRAVRALALYPDDPAADQAHAALLQLLDDPPPAGEQPGADFVLRRAALESLAEVGTPDDVAVITPFLRWGVDDLPDTGRDLRAAAAHALRVLGSTLAVPPLRARQRDETEPQVQFAITEALRALLGSGS
jgi:hypothetical protein